MPAGQTSSAVDRWPIAKPAGFLGAVGQPATSAKLRGNGQTGRDAHDERRDQAVDPLRTGRGDGQGPTDGGLAANQQRSSGLVACEIPIDKMLAMRRWQWS